MNSGTEHWHGAYSLHQPRIEKIFLRLHHGGRTFPSSSGLVSDGVQCEVLYYRKT